MQVRLFCLLLALLCLARPVRAAPAPADAVDPAGPGDAEAPTVAQAQIDEVLVKEGFRTADGLRQAGDLEGALRVLRMTYERVRTPFLLWPTAELCLQLQQPLLGLQALKEYADKVPPAERGEADQPTAAQVAALWDRLRAQVARLQVETDEPGVLVLLDGRQLGRTPLDKPVELDPGRHRVEARGPRTVSTEIVLAPGERRGVTLRVTPPPSRRLELGARWALLGLGVAALGAGGVLLGEDVALCAAGSCAGDLRAPGAALLGVGAGVLGAAALLVGIEIHRAGGGARGLRAVLRRF